jgi:hypothetical protein
MSTWHAKIIKWKVLNYFFAFWETFGRKSFLLRALGPERHEKSNHGTNFRSKMFIGKRICTDRESFLKVFSPKLQISKLNIKSTPNKHFGTKVRTMVRFFVPLWFQSSQQKTFPTESFSKSKKVIKYLSLNDFCVSSRLCARLGSNLPAVWRFFTI